jgi:competence protein ComEC
MWLAGLPRSFGTALLNERERWALWLPVAFGTGIGTYFALPSEPSQPIILTLPGFVGAFIIMAIVFDRAVPRACCIGLATLLIGFGVAKWRCESVAAPVVMHRLGPVELGGRVESAQLHGTGMRAVLAPISIAGVGAKDLPRRVRVSVRRGGELLAPGAIVRLNAVLMPPPPPASPGDYDFGRAAFFERIGAVG